jgi:hypothetical protein
VLGEMPDAERPAATIIAPAKPEQRIAERVRARAFTRWMEKFQAAIGASLASSLASPSDGG